MSTLDGMDPTTARRLVFASCLSVAVHAVLLSLLRFEPVGAGSPAPRPLQARLEPASDPPPEPEHQPALLRPVPQATAGSQALAPLPNETSPRDERTQADAKEAAPQHAAPRADASSGITMPVARDLTYYPVSALDAPPRPLGSTDLCYPEGASGEVAYLLLIDEAGTVDQATLVAVSPQGVFTAAAIASCRALKFAPATKDGRAVRSRVRFVVGPNPSN